MALLKQGQFETYNFVDQSLMLLLLREDFLDKIEIKHVRDYATQYVSFVSSVHKELYDEMYATKDITDEQVHELKKIARDFDKLFVAPEA